MSIRTTTASATTRSADSGNCDIPAQQALFTKTLRTAADKWGVDLRVQDQPIVTDAETGAFLEQLKKTPPDGLIVVPMSLQSWKPAQQIIQDRGEIPTIIYSHVSGFTSHLQAGRKTPGVLIWPRRRASSGSIPACGC